MSRSRAKARVHVQTRERREPGDPARLAAAAETGTGSTRREAFSRNKPALLPRYEATQ